MVQKLLTAKPKVYLFLSIVIGVVVLSSNIGFNKNDIGALSATNYYAEKATLFAASTDSLLNAVEAIDRDSSSWISARTTLRGCRLRYKALSFFTSYFFASETSMYNAAPKFEVEEPELELVEPMGLQQIEALLFEDNVFDHKTEILDQVVALNSSVKDLKTLLYQFEASDAQVLESLKLEIIRIITLYISGYDAPMLKSGVSETLQCSKSIEQVLQPYFSANPDAGKELASKLKESISYLDRNHRFENFDRMEYILQYALPLQEKLAQFTLDIGLQLNTTNYLSGQQANLFKKGFIGEWDSIAPAKRKGLAELGKKLFFDPALSGNSKVSCSSCHQPDLYFADGKVKSPAFLKDSILQRNTPSLFYSGYQHMQFWDGRVNNLKEQVKNVLVNPLEMGNNEKGIVRYIASRTDYITQLNGLFGDTKNNNQLDQIAAAIASFVGGLQPMNSAFDRYISGDRSAMTEVQVDGFNLFMGKAQCGTCHFAPFFNSLVPPFYNISELEILGTTKSDNLQSPQFDDDQGRYGLYKIQYYQQAFKTPTVRNAAKTAPYMHNGAFKTMESVIEFYNQGGAAGLGLKTPNQTLSARPLNLTERESLALVEFINSLTDSININNYKKDENK